MAAFDTAITPTASTPATTSNSTLFTATNDSSLLVDITNVSTAAATVRVGITPSGGSVHWKLHDLSIPADDALLGVGPWIVQNGDKVIVASGSTGSVVTYSLTGLVTS